MNDQDLLEAVRLIADYQFGFRVGSRLFPNESKIQVSKKTGRPRYILLGDKLLATVRSSDGMLALTLYGGERLSHIIEWPRRRIIVKDSHLDKVLEMKVVKADWVSYVDENLAPNEEVLVYNSSRRLIGVGRVTTSGKTILTVSGGTVVKIREVDEKIRPDPVP
ncbi:MAG: PUA domain-containing protein [Candidatus Caldarchaeales archaeon]